MRHNSFVDMIRDFVNNPSGTPVEVMCDKNAMWLMLSTEGNVVVDADPVGNIFKKR